MPTDIIYCCYSYNNNNLVVNLISLAELGKGAWWFCTMVYAVFCCHCMETKLMVVGTFILSDLFLLFWQNQIP